MTTATSVVTRIVERGFAPRGDRPLLASAALDRLTHHSQFIEMKGESYRQRQRRLDIGGSITGEKEVLGNTASEKKGGDM